MYQGDNLPKKGIAIIAFSSKIRNENKNKKINGNDGEYIELTLLGVKLEEFLQGVLLTMEQPISSV